MSDLPSRESVRGSLLATGSTRPILDAVLESYVDSTLRTETEWRRIIDRHAAVLQLPTVIDAEGRYTRTWGELVDLILVAAIGDTGEGGS